MKIGRRLDWIADISSLVIIWDVDQHWTLAVALGDVDECGQQINNFIRLRQLLGILRDPEHHIDDGRLLEAVLPYAEGGAESVGRDLARDVEDRRRVVVRGRNARDKVRGARSARRQCATKTSNARVSVSSEGRALLVRRRDELDFRDIADPMDEMKIGTARDTEYVTDALGLEELCDDLSEFHLLRIRLKKLITTAKMNQPASTVPSATWKSKKNQRNRNARIKLAMLRTS